MGTLDEFASLHFTAWCGLDCKGTAPTVLTNSRSDDMIDEDGWEASKRGRKVGGWYFSLRDQMSGVDPLLGEEEFVGLCKVLDSRRGILYSCSPFPPSWVHKHEWVHMVVKRKKEKDKWKNNLKLYLLLLAIVVWLSVLFCLGGEWMCVREGMFWDFEMERDVYVPLKY